MAWGQNKEAAARIAERIAKIKAEPPVSVGKSIKGNWLLYEGARPTRAVRWRQQIVEDNKKSLDGITWRNLLAFGRQLFINLGPVRGAILEKATYSVGNAWLPIFR